MERCPRCKASTPPTPLHLVLDCSEAATQEMKDDLAHELAGVAAGCLDKLGEERLATHDPFFGDLKLAMAALAPNAPGEGTPGGELARHALASLLAGSWQAPHPNLLSTRLLPPESEEEASGGARRSRRKLVEKHIAHFLEVTTSSMRELLNKCLSEHHGDGSKATRKRKRLEADAEQMEDEAEMEAAAETAVGARTGGGSSDTAARPAARDEQAPVAATAPPPAKPKPKPGIPSKRVLTITLPALMTAAGPPSEGGDTRRGALVARATADREAAAQARGVRLTGTVVKAVTPGGAAETAGLKVGDLVAEIDGATADLLTDPMELLAAKRADKAIVLRVTRPLSLREAKQEATAQLDRVAREPNPTDSASVPIPIRAREMHARRSLLTRTIVRAELLGVAEAAIAKARTLLTQLPAPTPAEAELTRPTSDAAAPAGGKRKRESEEEARRAEEEAKRQKEADERGARDERIGLWLAHRDRQQQESAERKGRRPIEATARLGHVQLHRLALAYDQPPSWLGGPPPPLATHAGDLEWKSEIAIVRAAQAATHGKRRERRGVKRSSAAGTGSSAPPPPPPA